MKCQKVQTLIRRCVGDAAAGLGLHFLHMSQGPFSRDAGHFIVFRGYDSLYISVPILGHFIPFSILFF